MLKLYKDLAVLYIQQAKPLHNYHNTLKMPSRFQEMLKTQRQNTETARAGFRWEEDEDKQLIAMIADKKSTDEIAKTLQRTEGSIKTRLIIYAINKMDKENLTIEQASKLINMQPTDIQEYQDRKATREEKRLSRDRTVKKLTNITNADIYDLLQKISKSIADLKKQ